MTPSTREGFLYALAAYGWWGLVPFYFHWLGKEISPLEVLAHRIVWSALLLGCILSLSKRWPETLRCLRTRSLLVPLTISATLVGFNWLMYILGVFLEKIVQASLGYFILPLVSIVLGMVIFREHLRPLQQVAIAFATVGVVLLALAAGETPWLALALAVSFSLYGMIRKKVPVDGLTGLAVETIVLLPLALTYLAIHYAQQREIEDGITLFKLSLSGVVTAVPLLCFGQAARRLPFSTLGFLQYISPSLQFALAIWLFEEPVTGGWLNYVLVWIALAIFSVDSFRWYRRQVKPAEGAA